MTANNIKESFESNTRVDVVGETLLTIVANSSNSVFLSYWLWIYFDLQRSSKVTWSDRVSMSINVQRYVSDSWLS